MTTMPSPTRRPTVEEMNGYRQGCIQLMPNVPTSYDYVPHLSAGIVFCVLFSLSMTGHVVQGIRKRDWTSYVLATGALSKFTLIIDSTTSIPAPRLTQNPLPPRSRTPRLGRPHLVFVMPLQRNSFPPPNNHPHHRADLLLRRRLPHPRHVDQALFNQHHHNQSPLLPLIKVIHPLPDRLPRPLLRCRCHSPRHSSRRRRPRVPRAAARHVDGDGHEHHGRRRRVPDGRDDGVRGVACGFPEEGVASRSE